MNLPHATSAGPDLTESPNITLLTASVDKNQGALSEKRAPDLDSSPLDIVLSESWERSLGPWNNKDNEDTPRILRG